MNLYGHIFIRDDAPFQKILTGPPSCKCLSHNNTIDNNMRIQSEILPLGLPFQREARLSIIYGTALLYDSLVFKI